MARPGTDVATTALLNGPAATLARALKEPILDVRTLGTILGPHNTAETGPRQSRGAAKARVMNRTYALRRAIGITSPAAARIAWHGFLFFVFGFAVAAAGAAEPAVPPKSDPARLFRLGEKIELKGHAFYVAKRGGGQVALSAPLPPTAPSGRSSRPWRPTRPIGRRTPAARRRSSSTARAGAKRGRAAGPTCMPMTFTRAAATCGTAHWDAWLWFDLGQVYNVSGMYIWNYNEKGDWNSRSVKEFDVSASADDKSFTPVGSFTLQRCPARKTTAARPSGSKAR